ncbi:conjugal transfer protein [Thermoactinomyces sp. DSM 45892]|uniref:conjugal transfer protein n=1 Tax=Thermoactinomyces sp. DSM 45892 TaxID=1882753 RepID=UPI00089D48AB|nr:conjugal transfer protein [Thermoactinomyces sp. DSM 45892]SDZ33159.1 Conjugative transposon protein TcpC [Thermoactinomyces sp. DSM 45892]
MIRKKGDHPREFKVIKGMRSKKILIWGLLTANVVALPVGFFYFKDKTVVTGGTEQEAPVMSQTARAFAEDFVSTYFSLHQGFEDHRAESLKPFLMKGLDKQAGLESIEVNLSTGKVRVWKVEKKSPNKATMMVQAEVYIRDKSDKVLSMDKRFLAVPIESIGNGQFVVSEIPYYVSEPSAPNVALKEETLANKADSSTKKEVETYLNTFFQDYVSGNMDKLSSYTKSDSKRIEGMNGVLEFVKIKELEVYKEKQVVVKVKAQFKEKEETKTNGVYTYPYTIQLEKNGDRWLISSMETK